MKTEAINFKTVYNKIRSMPPTVRRETVSGTVGEHWLSLLTPTQFAALFPDYYKKPLPDVGLTLAASGGVVLGGRSPTVTSATPWSGPSSSGGSGGTTYSGGGGSSTASPVPAPPPDPNKVLEDKLKAAGVVLPEPEVAAGAIDRTRFAKELEANPQVKADLLSLAHAETGGQGPEAQQTWMETVFNRAHAKGKTIAEVIDPRGVPGERGSYWPVGQHRPTLSEKQIEEKSKLLDGVLKGSNLSNYATDNASNQPGNQLASKREAKLRQEGREDQGKWVNGEYFYVDTHYADAMRRLRKETEERLKIGSETGSTEESGLKPKSDKPSAEPIPRPEGMNDELSKFFDSLSPARQQALLQQLDKIGGLEKLNEMAKEAPKTASGIPHIPTATPDNSRKYPAGEERFFREGGRLVSHTGAKLNEKLINVLKAASKDLPEGYHIRMFSGADARDSGTKNHPGGVAVDLKIVDGQGRILRDRGFGEGHKIYEQLAQSMKIRGQEMYPETDYIWGGAWTVAGGDRMHYQIVDPDQKVYRASQTSGAYSFEHGIKRNGFWAGENAANQFMTKEELENYKETIRAKIKAEKESATPVIGSETGSTEESGLKPRIRGSEEDSPPVPLEKRGITSGHPNETPKESAPQAEPSVPNTTNPRAPDYVPPTVEQPGRRSAPAPTPVPNAPTVTPAPAPTPPGVSSPQVTPKKDPPESVLPPVEVPQNQSSAPQPKPVVQTKSAEMGTKVEPHSPSAQRAYAQTNFEPKHFSGGSASVSRTA